MGGGGFAPSSKTQEKMIRGSVVWVNLGDAHPPEFGKTRPGLVLSNTEQNQVLDTVVIIPLSTRAPEIWPLRLRVPAFTRGRASFAVVPGIRQVSKQRLQDVIGTVPSAFLQTLKEAVSVYLGD